MSTTLRPTRPRPTRKQRRAEASGQSVTLAAVVNDAAPVSPIADRAVMRWLLASALAVALAVAVGGITRLTESGLSITQWKPVSGVLPPVSASEWNEAYARYLAIPEAQTVHRGITLDSFKALYWWEWTHRMLARCVGLVLAAPFFVLLLRRRIRPGMRLRLMNLPLLAALQGGMGWYMVQSGLSGRTGVSPYRLVAHLAVALVIFAIATWTASELREPARHRHSSGIVNALKDGGTRARGNGLPDDAVGRVCRRTRRRSHLQHIPAHGRAVDSGGLRCNHWLAKRLRESDRRAAPPPLHCDRDGVDGMDGVRAGVCTTLA